MIYDPARRSLELRQRIIESMTPEELEKMARADAETPLEELVRVAGEVANELYYLRSDNSYRIPNGVMNRLKVAVARVQSTN